MQVYKLTKSGYALSHYIRNPDTTEWRIIHHLAKMGHASKDQLITYLNSPVGEVSRAIAMLKIRKFIVEEGSFKGVT